MKRLLREFPQICYCLYLVKNFEPLMVIPEMEFSGVEMDAVEMDRPDIQVTGEHVIRFYLPVFA